MNRQSKRMMQRQGARDADGQNGIGSLADTDADLDAEALEAGTASRPSGGDTRRRATGESGREGARMTPARFAREVRNELRQVVWPNRSELINYTTVVLTVLVIMIALIFVLNLAFGKAVLYLFQR